MAGYVVCSWHLLRDEPAACNDGSASMKDIMDGERWLVGPSPDGDGRGSVIYPDCGIALGEKEPHDSSSQEQ